ncbi:MAG: histidine phosphatase family protein [Acidimicrobiia bacterium]
MMLAIVRHGQAVGNTTHRFIGWQEVPLDDLGHQQAGTVADRLARAGIERVISSDILRARQTAQPLASMLGVEIEIDERLREIGNGQWTGLLPSEIAAGWPELWQAYITGTDVARPDGERWQDVRARVVEAMTEHVESPVPTAVFTHGGPVILTAEWALGLTLPGNIFRGVLAVPANTSVTTLEGGKLVTYGDAGHLGAVTHLEIPYEPVE